MQDNNNQNYDYIKATLTPAEPEKPDSDYRPYRKSSNLKLSPETQKQLKIQADKLGITQAMFVTVLIARYIKGADKAGFEQELNSAKMYMPLS